MSPADRPFADVPETPEAHLGKARKKIGRGDHASALGSIGMALALDPWCRPARDMVGVWAESAGEAAEEILSEGGDDPLVGIARACLEQRRGNTEAALLELARATQPDARLANLEAWTFEWIEPEAAFEQVVPAQLEHLIQLMLFRTPDHPEGASWQREAIERGLATLDRLDARGPEAGKLYVFNGGGEMHTEIDADRPLETDKLRTIALSKLGRYDEAIALCRASHARAPSWETAVALANALRRQGDRAGAIAAFEEAVGHRPEDAGARLDLGDMHLDGGDFTTALRWYEEVLAREETHSWALPSALYCRLKLTGDQAWLKKLRGLMDHEDACTCGQRHMFAALLGGDDGDPRMRAGELLERLKQEKKGKGKGTGKAKKKKGKGKGKGTGKAKKNTTRRKPAASRKKKTGKKKTGKKKKKKSP